MIYLVTQQILPQSNRFTKVTPKEALMLLEPLKEVGLDTETRGFDPYTKQLTMLQLGCFDYQVVIDLTTVSIEFFKEYLESDRLFIGWNLKFDLKFLYHQRIIVRKCYDGFLAEKLLWLGYPSGMHRMSLKAAGNTYLGIDLDKTVRGKFLTSDLSEELIIYGAGDVKYLPIIKEKQLKELEKKNLLGAIVYENKSVNWIAYTEYCGAKLDVKKWKYKMVLDETNVEVYEQALKDWVNASYRGEKYGYHYLEVSKIKEKDLKKARSKMAGVRCPEMDKKGAIRGVYEAFKVEIEQRVEERFMSLSRQGDLWTGFQTEPTCEINWNSALQVAPLFTSLGFNLKVPDKETGELKDSVEGPIINGQKEKSSLAYIYLQYKAAMKVTSTYGMNVIRQINPVTGRIHTNLNQLGADTGRLSSGGKDKANKLEYLNFQNFPSDAETRACFIPEKNHKWISCDYSGQESRIITDITNDPAMVELFNNGCGDVHSLVAKMAYPDIIGDTPVEDIKRLFPKVRNDVKSQVEFPINYGGDFNTIMSHANKSKEEAMTIYNNYMKGFVGIKDYQDRQKANVMRLGYIILNAKTQHKSYIYDFDRIKGIERRFNYEYWAERKPYKGKGNPYLPTPIKLQVCDKFAKGDSIESIIGTYSYEKKVGNKIKVITKKVSKADAYNIPVKYFFRRKSAIEKQSINYP